MQIKSTIFLQFCRLTQSGCDFVNQRCVCMCTRVRACGCEGCETERREEGGEISSVVCIFMSYPCVHLVAGRSLAGWDFRQATYMADDPILGQLLLEYELGGRHFDELNRALLYRCSEFRQRPGRVPAEDSVPLGKSPAAELQILAPVVLECGSVGVARGD